VARLGGDWEADIAAFDDIVTEILTLADALGDGIVAQFPDQFAVTEPTEPEAASLAEQAEAPAEDGTISREAWSLQRAMHRLWADHVVWTRDYVVAALAGAPDAKAAAARLLGNQEDIGNAIVPLYGEEAGAKLTDLLKQHILIAVDLVDLVKAEDFGERFEELDRRWDENASAIARHLADLNPNWPEKDVRDLLAQHLALTKREVDARIFGEWEEDIAAFDDIMTEILTLADALSDGIIKQFPDRFGGGAPGNAAPARRAASSRTKGSATPGDGATTAPTGSAAKSGSRRRPGPITLSSSRGKRGGNR
jgi:hypothetical protein